MQNFAFVKVVQAKEHLHEPVDNQCLFEQLPFLLPLFHVHRQVTELAVLHDHNQHIILKVVLFKVQDIFMREFLMYLRLLERLLLFLFRHALEVDLLCHKGLVGSFVYDEVDSAVVAAADQLFLCV